MLAKVASVLALAGAVAPSAAQASGGWKGEPTYLSGRHQISAGELIYTDYLYDDYGPDRNGRPDQTAFRANLAPTNGDLRYPPADGRRHGFNAADLRELRVAIRGDELRVRFALQTMLAPDVTAAILAVDTDGDAATGAARWPGGANITTPGADRFVVTWGTGARVVDASGAAGEVPVEVDLDANTYDVAVPLARLGELEDDARVLAGVGLARPGGGGFTADGLWNVAFRGDDDWPLLQGHWGEHEQSQALARGDIGAFSAPLRPDLLRAGGDAPFRLEPGFYNRHFRSQLDLGEGIDLKRDGPVSGDARPMFKGRWQPYGLHVPKGYDPSRPAPLLLDGHSLDINHNQYRSTAPGQLAELGDERGSLVITPLARGTDTWYLDAGLADVLEAWRDVRRHLAVDEDRTSIAGYSMGGYMTYRLGMLMPDRFARASVYVGPQAYYFNAPPFALQTTPEWEVAGDTRLLVENAGNLPFEIVHGTLDELVPITGVRQQVDRLIGAGTAVRFHHHQADDHLSFTFADRWGHTREWLGDARVDRSPARVRFRRYPGMDLPHRGIRFDRAYWVSDIEVQGDDGDGDSEADGLVDAVTHGHGGSVPRPERLPSRPDPAPVGISPATIDEQRQVAGEPLARGNRFAARFERIESVRFDLARMGLRADRTIEARLRGDGRLTVRLAGRFRRGTSVRAGGRRLRVVRSSRELRFRVDLTAKERVVRVVPGRAARRTGGKRPVRRPGPRRTARAPRPR